MVADVRLRRQATGAAYCTETWKFSMEVYVSAGRRVGRIAAMILGNVHVHVCVHIGGTRLRPLGFDRQSVTEK
jgi:hypothetical protein